MNETDIRRYALLMKELDLSGLEITEDNKAVRLERSSGKSYIPTSVIGTESSTPEAKSKTENDNLYTVKSPMVGVFYASGAENAEPYVTLGDKVEKGKTLCIIEAMKLMNEISADVDGTIEEICVTNGQVVEYGTELFRIKR